MTTVRGLSEYAKPKRGAQPFLLCRVMRLDPAANDHGLIAAQIDRRCADAHVQVLFPRRLFCRTLVGRLFGVELFDLDVSVLDLRCFNLQCLLEESLHPFRPEHRNDFSHQDDVGFVERLGDVVSQGLVGFFTLFCFHSLQGLRFQVLYLVRLRCIILHHVRMIDGLPKQSTVTNIRYNRF